MSVRMYMPSLRDHTILAYRGRTILAPTSEALQYIIPRSFEDYIEREMVRAPEMTRDGFSQWRGNRRPGQNYVTVATDTITRDRVNQHPEVYYRATLAWIADDEANELMAQIVRANTTALIEADAELRERTSIQYNHRGENIEVRRPMGRDASLRLTEISLVNPLTVPVGADVSELREHLERLLAQRMNVSPELLRGADLNAAESAIVGHRRQKALEELRRELLTESEPPAVPKIEIDFNKRVIRRRRD